MGRNLEPKCKQCRRAGEKLFLKGERCRTVKCAIVKRNYPPGFHGPKGRPRSTEYGIQLNEKQKAQKQYNLLEKQFRLTFEKAQSQAGNTAENFLKLLEMRFDNIIYRLGIGESRSQARQLINHSLFTINDRNVNIPSRILKVGDIIKIKSNKKNYKIFLNAVERIKKLELPNWLILEKNTLETKILNQPDINSLKANFNIQMIVEFYSR
jgi:small subunit ribosomal protein S4